MSLASVVTDVIGLTAGLHIGIHPWRSGHIVATELRVRHFVIDRIIHTSYSRYFI